MIQSAPRAVNATCRPSGDGAAAMLVPSWKFTDTSRVAPRRVFRLVTGKGTATGASPGGPNAAAIRPPSLPPPQPAIVPQAMASTPSRTVRARGGRGRQGARGAANETSGRARAIACFRMVMVVSDSSFPQLRCGSHARWIRRAGGFFASH
jgi:hypothetical protein